MKRLVQREKLYLAEKSVWPAYGSPTPEAAQGWYDWVVRTKWWKDHSPVRHFRVVYPVFGRMSGIVLDGDIAIIEFGPFSLTLPGLVHEAGHLLDYHEGTGAAAMERDHNEVYAGILLALVKRYVCAGDAEQLQKEFDERGILYTPYV